MKRRTTMLLAGAATVAVLYQPVVGFYILGGLGAYLVVSFINALYRNRLKPLPNIKKIEEKKKPEVAAVVPIGQSMSEVSMIQREVNFMSEKFQERAVDNGYQTISDVPQQLKI